MTKEFFKSGLKISFQNGGFFPIAIFFCQIIVFANISWFCGRIWKIQNQLDVFFCYSLYGRQLFINFLRALFVEIAWQGFLYLKFRNMRKRICTFFENNSFENWKKNRLKENWVHSQKSPFTTRFEVILSIFTSHIKVSDPFKRWRYIQTL